MDNKPLNAPWTAPDLPETIPHGDMPGDKICIDEGHVAKAQKIFPALKDMLAEQFERNPHQRAVICVCGGSGVGKSEIASILSYYLGELGVGSYTLSGDNYPRRIPMDNDAERLRVFRTGGLRGLVDSGLYAREMASELETLWREEKDADPELAAKLPWLGVYRQAGYRSLAGYLGTEAEIDFDEVSGIIARFKRGENRIALKRMGRERTELWYDEMDMTGVQVLVIEWTHGNSDLLRGVDIPILLNSTPAETLAHRRARGRDAKADSAFTTMVLEIEQKKLDAQAWKAKIILSKSGELLDYNSYRQLMANA